MAQFEAAMLARTAVELPWLVRRAGVSGQQRAVQLALTAAHRHRFETLGEAMSYLHLMAAFGSAFEADPLHPWARQALTYVETIGSRADDLREAGEPLRLQLVGARARRGMRLLLAARRIGFPPALPEAGLADAILGELAGLDSRRLRYAGVEHVRGWIMGQRDVAATRGLEDAAGWLLHAALAYMLGHAYAEDPLHPWAPPALAALAECPPEARAASLHRAALAGLLPSRRDPA